MDLRCGQGLLLGAALNSGARWAFGWDRPARASLARRLLLAQGHTRFDSFGVDLSLEISLMADVTRSGHTLDGVDVVVLSPPLRERSFVPELLSLPWTTVVYESSKGEPLSELKRALDPVLAESGAAIGASSDGLPGEGSLRSVLALRRYGELGSAAAQPAGHRRQVGTHKHQGGDAQEGQ